MNPFACKHAHGSRESKKKAGIYRQKSHRLLTVYPGTRRVPKKDKSYLLGGRQPIPDTSQKKGHTSIMEQNETTSTVTSAPEQQNGYYNFVENPAEQYFTSGKWDSDRAFLKQSNLVTGYTNMDTLQALYPGLYVIGAIPSLGKTTLIHQMADQIAMRKQPVMYFSYEQSANELYAKAIARRIHMQAKRLPSSARYAQYTAMEIRRGVADGTQELANQVANYTKDVENYLDVIECNFDCPVETISAIVEKHINDAPSYPPPVVIIDYLQVIHPSFVNGKVMTDQRASVDHIIKALKQMQKAHSMVVIVISNLNRMNYMLPVDFESFKESGGIEYTADVVWGMNLTLTTDPDFEYKTLNAKNGTLKETTLREKRIMLSKAKAADVRDIEIKVLKNRFGPVGISMQFEYEPQYDTFMASTLDRYNKHKKNLGLYAEEETEE